MGQRDDHIDLRTRFERALGDPNRRITDLLELSAELGEELAARDPDAAVIVLRAAAVEAADRPADRDAQATVRVLRDLTGALEQVIETRDRQLQQVRMDLRELNDRAHLDGLTGLVNRDGLTSAMHHLATRRERCAVLAIDLDRFGRLNETLGHQAGDELLVEQARRLMRIARPRDTVARWGSDEFVVVMPGVEDLTSATSIAQGVREALALPFHTTGGGEVVPSITVGVAAASGAMSDPEGLLREADLALERAKALGKGRIELFDAELEDTARQRFATEALIRSALDDHLFELYFQPVHSNSAGYPLAAEALLRLHHPDGRVLAPGAFLDVAEETGLTREIGDWVLDESCRIAAGWAVGGRPFHLAVNVAAAQLDAGFPARVADALARHGVAPTVLVLELTEHTLLEADDEQVNALVELRSTGVRVALDDFGTSYSSLSHLRRFPIDVVKIDQSFVAGLRQSEQDGAIVRAVVGLSETFQFRVIAEGVETVEQLDEQRVLGCHGAQGFLIGEPKPAAVFGELLAMLPIVTGMTSRN
jgi:diguanylate cyclase (GGDEF)-like protein